MPERRGDGDRAAGDVLGDLAAEQERLAGILASLDGEAWRAPSGAPGWTVADVVLHLAQSEEFVVATLAGPGARAAGGGLRGGVAANPWGDQPAGGGIDAVVDALVRAERSEPAAIFERWQRARQAALAALAAADPDRAVPWAATPLRPRTLATTRLAEHWAHGLDITGPLGVALEDTSRLRHVAWLAHRSLPYAFAAVGEKAPTVRCQLTGPGPGPGLVVWAIGPADAAVRIVGPAGDFCRVGARRMTPGESRLRADGPGGRRVLELLRNYAQ